MGPANADNSDREMKAGQIAARGLITLVEVDDLRPPREGEAIVTPETGCLCGSDIPYFSEPQPRYPLTPGLSLHEIVGRVTSSASPAFREGDRVLAMPLGLLGCAEQLLVPDDRLVRVDEALSNEAAVISQPMATVLSALSAVPNVIGLTVAVVGQGPIGQLFNACLSGAGAARVIGIDVREARVARSCEFGATDVVVVSRDDEGAGAFERVREITGGTMADLVVEAVGHAEQQFNLATALARNKGRVLYFGIPPDRLDGIAFEPVVRKSLTIHTSVPDDLRPFVTIAMRAIRQGRIDPLRLITHRLPFGDLQTAFETYRNRRDGALKVVLNF
jgi:threonine dehydrogenase-like Zn-dependent dehydrogenase